MTTVKELIKYLEGCPQDTEVECLVEECSGWNIYTNPSPLDLEDSPVIDYTGEEWKDSPSYGRVFVELRGK